MVRNLFETRDCSHPDVIQSVTLHTTHGDIKVSIHPPPCLIYPVFDPDTTFPFA